MFLRGGAVNRMEHALRHGDVDALGVRAQFRGVDGDERLGAVGKIRIIAMFLRMRRSRLGDNLAFRDETFHMKFDGFWNAMARASSSVAPALKQPGKSGTVTP